MISEWMENGDIMSFVSTVPNQNPFSLVGTSHSVKVDTDFMGSWWM